ncbi:hypothetical protein GDO86_015598 [Hymenochirus boettgeri]|uniref:Uncharacterized protein n=1 Tax=Hymenochirus boettgeri TaxID=247094 RepID=A0A8T2JY01_9PIPI|nr:hypothetical protein GDO86_015598 [Hymenochirus boettgeri]
MDIIFPISLFLLDSCLNHLSAKLFYKYYPYEVLGFLWLMSIIKIPVLTIISQRLKHPIWIPSGLIYILTLCLSSTLYQTLRLFYSSQVPTIYLGLSNSLLNHIPPLLSCLFWNLFSPYVLLNKTDEPKSKTKEMEYFLRLLNYSRPDCLPLGGAFLFLTFALIGEVFIPYYMGRVIDILSTEYKESDFLMAMLSMAVFSITSSIFAGCRGGLFMFSLSRLTKRLRLLLFRSVVQQEISFFETTKSGEIVSRLSNDTARVSRSIAGNVNITIRMLVKCLGVYSFMFSLSWQLTLLTFISSPITWIIQKLYSSYHQDLVQKVQESIAKSSDVAKEIIESVKTVHSFAAEEEEAKRYEKSLQETHELQTRRDFVTAFYLLATRIVNLMTQVAMLLYGQYLIQSGFITSGKMVSFILYQMESGDYIRTLVHMLSEITHSAGAAQKVFQYMDRTPQVSPAGSLCPDDLHGQIEFKNVTFYYPSRLDVPVLKDISFTLHPGRVTALVGPSGGGKTTCVSLLERFYEPQEGNILLDGKPLNEYKHEYLHSKVALVAQEPILFAGSVRENIVYGCENITEEQIKEAARKAKAEDFISGMEKSYDSDVGDSGAQLSAGQKQRVALARALARNPKLLILDEASSCLDADTEQQIQQCLQNILGLSVLIIAHRLRTVQKADQIIVLKDGCLVEHGTHDELVKQKGEYYGLLQGNLLENKEVN